MRVEPMTRRLTQREIDARRENAKKSTGPRSAAGKARVRLNAMKHGVTARLPEYIPRGPLRESPNEVATFIAAVVELLAPLNVLARDRAERIANLLWRQRRSRRWEVAGLAAVGVSDESDVWMEHKAEEHEFAAQYITQLETAELDRDHFEALTIVFYHGANLDDIEGWREGEEPSTPEGWRDLIKRILTHKWESPAEASMWAAEHAPQIRVDAMRVRLPAMEAAARAAVEDGFFSKLLTLEGRLTRELSQTLAEYEAFQQLGPDEANETGGSAKQS
jgi:hypothetical protein